MSRSTFLLSLEEFSPDKFTELASWLGFGDCAYSKLPHANDPARLLEGKSTLKDEYAKWYHTDYNSINVSCGRSRVYDSVAMSSTSFASFRFYLHEELAAPFQGLEAAFHLLEPLDSHLSIDAAQHLNEAYLLRAMRNHPLRTMDEAAADIHVAPALTLSSFYADLARQDTMKELTKAELGRDVTSMPRRLSSHDSRIDAFARLLGSNAAFRARKPFFVVVSGWQPWQVNSELLHVLSKGHVTLGVTDPGFKWAESLLMRPNMRYSTLPYRAHHLNADPAAASPTNKSLTYFFAGNCDRHDSGLRQTMLAALSGLPSYVPTSITKLTLSTCSNVREADKIAESQLEMRKADMCLVPSGDTITSRRLFDALATGCIPLLIVSPGGHFLRRSAGSSLNTSGCASCRKEALRLHAQRHLPFPNVIEWSRIVFFTVMDDASEGASYLKYIASTSMAQRREEMRALGRDVFNRYLNNQYHPKGVVSAIMMNAATAADHTVEKLPSTASAAPPTSRCLGPGGRPSGGRVVFVKTHNTGSGSVFNILARSALNRRLKVALPRKQGAGAWNTFGFPGSFPDAEELYVEAALPDLERGTVLLSDVEAEQLPNAHYLNEGAPFDALFHHARFSPNKMRAAVPSAPVVTIVRDPAEQFVSAWDL